MMVMVFKERCRKMDRFREVYIFSFYHVEFERRMVLYRFEALC
jgi:hypothetical protein